MSIGNRIPTHVFSYPWITRLSTFRPITPNSSAVDFLLSDFIITKDRGIWVSLTMRLFLSRGQYSVKSGYKVAMLLYKHSSTPSEDVVGTFMELKNPFEGTTFCLENCWKLLAVLIFSRHIEIQSYCPVCGRSMETTVHALFGCY